MKIEFAFNPAWILRQLHWLAFVIFLYFYIRLFRNALIDDSFITLNYVRTLVSSGTWGFYPGYTANSATSPLNVLLLALVSLFTGPTEEAIVWLAVICHLVIAAMLTRISRQMLGTVVFGWLGALAILFNPLLISTLGLESILFAALFTVSIHLYLSKKWGPLAIVMGLLTLARAEGVLFFLVFVALIPEARIKSRVAFIYMLVIMPWYVFSWVYLGSLAPDTFFIKTDQGVWMRWNFFNGLDLYYGVYQLETILSFVFLLPASLFLYRKNRESRTVLIIGLTGLIHFVGYSLLGVPPFHWYYAPEVVAIILMGSLILGVTYQRSQTLWYKRVYGLLVIVYFLMPISGMLYLLSRDHFSVGQVPIHSNWATHQQYKEIGLWLKREHKGDTIRLSVGEIGTLAYYCECYLLDHFSDRKWLKEYIDDHTQGSGMGRILYEINFALFSFPEFREELLVMRTYPGIPSEEVGAIRRWNISTKWIQEGVVILSHR